MARKGKYETYIQPFLQQIQEWYGILTEKQIAKKLGVSSTSFENYKNQHPELREVLQKGKQTLIVDLKQTLKKKAIGFSYKERKTYIKEIDGNRVRIIEEYEKYAQPDTGAIHLLLKNLDPEWRNDDQVTVDLRREKLALEREKTESGNW